MLVEKLVKIFKKKTIRFLDIGTGAGCILISLLTELKDSFGVGIDLSNKAVLIANKNVDKHLLKDKKRVRVYRRSFSQFFNKKFDLIVCNPPYISTKDLKNLNDDIKKYEPKLALDGGNDGLDVIQKVIYKSKEILKIKGLLALEIGNGQNKKVSKILKKNKFKIEYVIEEYPGSTRCLISSYSN